MARAAIMHILLHNEPDCNGGLLYLRTVPPDRKFRLQTALRHAEMQAQGAWRMRDAQRIEERAEAASVCYNAP
jgi:hypothetical protein